MRLRTHVGEDFVGDVVLSAGVHHDGRDCRVVRVADVGEQMVHNLHSTAQYRTLSSARRVPTTLLQKVSTSTTIIGLLMLLRGRALLQVVSTAPDPQQCKKSPQRTLAKVSSSNYKRLVW